LRRIVTASPRCPPLSLLIANYSMMRRADENPPPQKIGDGRSCWYMICAS
jgi:hypothetical protein